jgi:hypothetical protein
MASTVDSDTGRMFALLAPVPAACARLFVVVRRTSPGLAALLVAAVAIQWLFNAPDVVIEPTSWRAGWPRRGFAIA